MLLVSKKNIFRALALYTMVVLFLPIIVMNIPEPLNILTKNLILVPIWLFMCLIYYPSLFASRYIITLFLFFIIMLLGSLTIWDDYIITGMGDITIKWIIIDIYGAFLSILMYQFFLRTEDFKGLALISLITLTFILITSITSIKGLNVFPEAIRDLASGSDTKEIRDSYQRLGIANYPYTASVVYLFPILVYFIKKKDTLTWMRFLVFGFILILLYFLLKTQFTTALVLSLSFILFSIISLKNVGKTYLIYIALIFLFLFVLNSYIADLFYFFSDLVSSVTLKMRLNDIGKVLEIRDFSPYSEDTYFSKFRLSLIHTSWLKFLTNPIFGGGWGGGHSTWIDRLGLFGIVGFFPWILIFWQQVKLNLSIFTNTFKAYYLLSVSSCIILGVITTMANSVQSGVIVFFVVPGLYFIRYLKRNNDQTQELF